MKSLSGKQGIMKKIIITALEEDLSDVGDITGSAIFQQEKTTFKLIAKQSGLLCGIGLVKEIFTNTACRVDCFYHDGDSLIPGITVARITGLVAEILSRERVALNFLAHLSGIATLTAEFVRAARGKAVILDTRKTLPGLRSLQKYAVTCGGGKNHRMGLYDMVMIKDNHIDSARSISRAVKLVRERWHQKYKIEVETRNLTEVKEALNCGIDVIMLDNMVNEDIVKAVELCQGKVQLEVSGNVTLERVSELSELGIDYISVGKITHSAPAFDFSLKKEEI
ncbi:MAG: carboxylating nicotinate-nucleotide diphosphorylase [Candidatus Cloacimonetes bacterium]|nr:carboxylating nicotinate-nucleotide diphosphorylase [Candidatus Cloacimonadota bacterium]